MSIASENFETVDGIRGGKVLAAKEAIERGAMDTPDIFDNSLDMLIDRAFVEEEIEDARQRLMDDEFQRMTESDR